MAKKFKLTEEQIHLAVEQLTLEYALEPNGYTVCGVVNKHQSVIEIFCSFVSNKQMDSVLSLVDDFMHRNLPTDTPQDFFDKWHKLLRDNGVKL